MSVARRLLVFAASRGTQAPRGGGAAGAVTACAFAALIAAVTGCTPWGEPDGGNGADDENVTSVSLASRFTCASAFGLIGAATYMTGDVIVPSGDVVGAATTPAGSPVIDCTNGGTVVITWEPIKVQVPVNGGMTGKILLDNFIVYGTPGALVPGACVAPTACNPGYDDPNCADDGPLLWFDTKACTVATFTAGLCQLSKARTQICGAP